MKKIRIECYLLSFCTYDFEGNKMPVQYKSRTFAAEKS